MSIRKHWGEEGGQTVGKSDLTLGSIYLRGYNNNGETTRIYINNGDISSLIAALLDVQRRKG